LTPNEYSRAREHDESGGASARIAARGRMADHAHAMLQRPGPHDYMPVSFSAGAKLPI
jgi:hypothetical protein